MIRHIISQTLKGKTINRMLMNGELKNIAIRGKVLDLGAGKIQSSYLEFISTKDISEIISVDISPERKPDIVADIEKPLPFQESSFDSILCFNLLEHIYGHKQLLSEIFRILKPGGELVGYVPFLVKFHPDPNDYFRYTEQGLKRLFKDAGFAGSEIKFIGRGALTAAWSQSEYFLPRPFRWILTIFVFSVDKLVLKMKPVFRKKYALGYVFRAHK